MWINKGYCTAVQELVLWAGVSDQWLSTTLDQNVALLIGLWQNTELGVCKKHLMYIILLSFWKPHHSCSFWVLQHVKFVMVINNKRFQNLFKFLGKIIKILVLMAFLNPLDLTTSFMHFWVLQHVKFVMVINNKRFQNFFKFLGKIIKILVLMAFLNPLDLIFCLYLTSRDG